MTKKNRKYLSKNNKKNEFYDKYTENKRKHSASCVFVSPPFLPTFVIS